MFFPSNTLKPEQEARKLVKAELASSGRLRRWKSKLHILPNDTDAILAALARQGSAQGSATLVDALLGLLISSGANESEVTRQLDLLLPALISNDGLRLFKNSSARFSVSALTSALRTALQSDDANTVDMLLESGADITALNVEEVAKVASYSGLTIQRLRLDQILHKEVFEASCDLALTRDSQQILQRLLRDITVVETTVRHGDWQFSATDRNSLLLRAVRLHKYDMLPIITNATPGWALQDAGVLLSSMLAVTEDPEDIQRSVITQILSMVSEPTLLDDQQDLREAFSYCLNQQKYDTILLMLRRDLTLPLEALKRVIVEAGSAVLDQILMHKIRIVDDIWDHIASLSVEASAAAREKLSMYMIRNHIEIPAVGTVLRQMIAANQADVVEVFINQGVFSPITDTTLLALAISCRSAHVVRVLLNSDINETCLENGLIATEGLASGYRSIYTRLVLKVLSTRSNGHFVEYMLLRLLCSIRVKYDQDTAKHMLKFVKQNMSAINNSRLSLLEASNVSALIECKEAIQAQSHGVGKIVVSEDNLCRDMERLDLNIEKRVVDLLKQHLLDCSEMVAPVMIWPTTMVDFLLAWLGTEIASSSVVIDCITVAIDHGQLQTLQTLLSRCRISIDDLLAIPPSKVVLTTAYIDSFRECLDRYGVPENRRFQLFQQWYNHACSGLLLGSATHMAFMLPGQLNATNALKCLKHALDNQDNLDSVESLLSSTIVQQNDLEELWIHVMTSRSPSLTTQIVMLLRLGYNGDEVPNALLSEASGTADITIIQAILGNWQEEKMTYPRSYFDHSGNPSAGYDRQTPNEFRYASTLAAMLRSAIVTQNVELCELLLQYGAPSIIDGKSLLDEAVHHSPNVSLADDRILAALLKKETYHSDPQPVYDRILLQAVKARRDGLVRNMLYLLASPQACGYEVWKSALLLSSESIFKALMSSDAAYKALRMDLCDTVEILFLQPELVDQVCTSLLVLRNAGFVELDYFDRVLDLLCESHQLSIERISLLARCGVRIKRNNSTCLKLAMAHSDFQVFRILLDMCVERDALTTCLADATDVVANGRVHDYPNSVAALELLASCNMPQYAVDSAFQQLMAMPIIGPEIVPILIHLLTKRAYIGNDGESLARCYLMDDDDLIMAALASQPSLQVRENALQWLLTADNRQHQRRLSKTRNEKCRMDIPHSTLRNLVGFILSTPDIIPHSVVDNFFDAVKIDSTLQPCSTNCSQELEGLLLSVVSNLEQEPLFMPSRLANLSTIVRWTKRVGPHWKCRGTEGVGETCSLAEDATTSLLLLACEKGFAELVIDLLNFDADPNSIDAAGQTALCIATKGNHDDIVEILVRKGAQPDDGSLHIAVCNNYQVLVALLLNFGHSPLHESALFGGATVLKAFSEAEHDEVTYNSLRHTINDLLFWMYEALDFDTIVRELMGIWKPVLQHRRAYDLMNALSDVLAAFDEPLELLQNGEFEVDNLRYSALSLITEWEEASLTPEERINLRAIFEVYGFKPMIYAEDGDQPDNAVNIPVQYHQRHAFRTKECAVCGDKAKSENDIFGGLVDACAPLHGWDDDVICSECLAEYLQTKMFPHEDELLKFNFPSAAVPCWAPQCQKTMLSHDDLRRLVDKDLFLDYDEALCQQTVNSEKSFVKCATPRCSGGIWYDEEADKEANKIFFCEVCYDNTCIECNALYNTHDGEPCPVGAEAKKGERIKEEERLSEATMKMQKRCPKCALPYEKINGCDHITCGLHTYSTTRGKGCGHHFCHVCYGDWHNGHHSSCAYGAR